MQYVTFETGFFHSAKYLEQSSILLYVQIFFWVIHIYGYTRISLSIHPLKDIWLGWQS